MNYSQAFLWMAGIVMTGIAVFIFYKRVKGHKDEKKLDSNRKSMAQRSNPVLSGKGSRAKASQGDNGIATQIPGVNHGNVNVIKITNYTLKAGKDLKGEQDSNTFEALRDDILSPGFSADKDVAAPGAKQETTHCNEKKKPGAKVYFLCMEKEQEVLPLAERYRRAPGDTSESGKRYKR